MPPASAAPPPLVMQLVVGAALAAPPSAGGWPRGPLMAQTAHAACAVVAATADAPNTRAYVAPAQLPHMRKLVLVAPPALPLRELAARLDEARARLGADEVVSERGAAVEQT
jgi:hypothetical protein